MKLITSLSDLDELFSQPRAFVFMYVNWAIQARQSEAHSRVFLTMLQREHPNEKIPIYRLDLSEQEGEVWMKVRKWLKEQGRPEKLLCYGGNGAMLWVRGGIVAAYVPYLAGIDSSKLMIMTQDVFEFGDKN